MSRSEGGRGCLSTLVLGIVFVVLLLLVLDRGGDFAAERVSASSLKSSQRLASSPDVHIDGFPFLNQFASGKYDHIRVDADEVPVGKVADLRLSHVQVDLGHATASHDFRVFTARTASATARIDYADLGRALGITVGYAGNGRVEASKRITVLGTTVTPRISVKPAVADGVLSFTALSAAGLTAAQQAATQALDAVFRNVSLKGLPFGIAVRSLHVDRQGLELTLTGRNLRYTR